MSSLKDIMDVDVEPLESQAMRSRQAAQQQNETDPSRSLNSQSLRQDQSQVSRRRSNRVSKPSSQSGSLRPNLSRRRSSGTAESMDSDSQPAGSSQMAGISRNPSRGSNAPDSIRYTPVTGRVSRAKKGQPVHVCDQCDPPRIFTRAEHLRRHQLGHQKPAYPCTFEDCEKAFHRPDLLARHLNRHETQGEKAYKAGDEGSRESSAGSSGSQSPSLKSHAPLIVENAMGGQAIQGSDSGIPRSATTGGNMQAAYAPIAPGLGTLNYSSPSPQPSQYQLSSVGTPAIGSNAATSSAAPSIGHLATSFPTSSVHNISQEHAFPNMSSTPVGQMYSTHAQDSGHMYPAVTTANGLPLLTLQVPDPPGLSFSASPWYSSSESTWSTPSDRHASWARDRSTSVATNPDNWNPQPMVWSPHYPNSSMQTPRAAGLEAVPENYESPPYVSPHLSPNTSYPLAGVSSPAGGYQDIVGIPALSGSYKTQAQFSSARTGRISKPELGRPDRGTSSLVEPSTHLKPSSEERSVALLSERLEEYLVTYWAILEPVYAIIHPETFNLHPSDNVKNAMAALGSQFHILPGDRENGSRLHEGCIKLIVPHAAWDFQAMQAIFLTEIFGRFRSQKIDVRPSAAFRKLYKILVDSSATDSSSIFARFEIQEINACIDEEIENRSTDEMPLTRDEVIENMWQQWIEYEVRQRLRAACFMFDSHQRFCYEQRRCQPVANSENTFIVLPCPKIVWTAATSQQWYKHIQTLDCAAIRLLHPEHMTAEQISRLSLSSQADAGFIVLEKLPSRDKVPLSSLNFSTNVDIIKKVVDLFPQFIHTHAYLALYHTPLHHLLSLTGNTWLFGQKLTSHSDIDAIAPTIRGWASSPAAAVATWHACHLLKTLFKIETEIVKPFRGVSEYWFLYTMTLIVWAFGHRTPSLSASGAVSANISRRASSVTLVPDDASEAKSAAITWCQSMIDLKPEHLPNALMRSETGSVIDTARWRLREEAVMSNGRSGMMLDAYGVLDRIREGGRWF